MAGADARKIGNVTAGLMVACALLVDGLQFLLTLTVVGSVVASILTPIIAFMFWLWFALMGVQYLGRGGGKKALIALTAGIAELVPFINALPVTTVGVVGIIATERAEEKKQAHQAARGVANPTRRAQAQARLGRMRTRRAQQAAANDNGRESHEEAA